MILWAGKGPAAVQFSGVQVIVGPIGLPGENPAAIARLARQNAGPTLGLVAQPESVGAAPINAGTGAELPQTKRARERWPSYAYCLQRAPQAHCEDNPASAGWISHGA